MSELPVHQTFCDVLVTDDRGVLGFCRRPVMHIEYSIGRLAIFCWCVDHAPNDHRGFWCGPKSECMQLMLEYQVRRDALLEAGELTS